MFELIASLMAWFYDLIPSYGVTIILLTLVVMMVVTPLTLKGTRSMLQMQRLQPELKRIQNEYRDDRPKMNEELMLFYQENGINPLGGCLPLLVQLPVFLVLYRVVQGLTRRVTEVGEQSGFTAGLQGSAQDLIKSTIQTNHRPFDPDHLDKGSTLYQSLAGSTRMESFGIDLSRSATEVFGESLVQAIPYIALIVVVLVSSIIQQRQIQGRNSGATMNPQQQMIMKVMPYFLPVFALTMPAALVVYFVVSNLWRIGQQAYITKSLYSGDESPGALLARQREAQKEEAAPSKRTTPKKDRPTPKADGTTAKSKGSDNGKKGNKKTTRAARSSGSKSADSSSGRGKTGKAPSRAARSGRVTPPKTTSANPKRKKGD